MMSVDNSQISDIATLLSRLRRRSVVIVGLMGAGKTVIGRRVATSLGLPFIDSDHEIETVSRMSVPELFENYGEDEFRALERRVIKRLLKHGPQVLSTGGGAFMNPEIREAIVRRAVSVWLKADLDTLMDRVAKRQNRPLLNAQDPRGIMQRLMDTRHPIYGEADMTIQSRDEPKEVIAGEVVAALAAYLEEEECNTKRAR